MREIGRAARELAALPSQSFTSLLLTCEEQGSSKGINRPLFRFQVGTSLDVPRGQPSGCANQKDQNEEVRHALPYFFSAGAATPFLKDVYSPRPPRPHPIRQRAGQGKLPVVRPPRPGSRHQQQQGQGRKQRPARAPPSPRQQDRERYPHHHEEKQSVVRPACSAPPAPLKPQPQRQQRRQQQGGHEQGEAVGVHLRHAGTADAARRRDTQAGGPGVPYGA